MYFFTTRPLIVHDQTGIVGRMVALQKISLGPNPPGPVNATSLGEAVFASVIKLSV